MLYSLEERGDGPDIFGESTFEGDVPVLVAEEDDDLPADCCCCCCCISCSLIFKFDIPDLKEGGREGEELLLRGFRLPVNDEDEPEGEVEVEAEAEAEVEAVAPVIFLRTVFRVLEVYVRFKGGLKD